MLVGLGVTVGIKVGIGVDVERFFNLALIPASIVAFMFWIGVGIGVGIKSVKAALTAASTLASISSTIGITGSRGAVQAIPTPTITSKMNTTSLLVK